MMGNGKDYEECRNISVKLLLKQPLHNHTHLFIKAHTKSSAFFTQAGGAGKCPPRVPLFATPHEITLCFNPPPQEKSLFPDPPRDSSVVCQPHGYPPLIYDFSKKSPFSTPPPRKILKKGPEKISNKVVYVYCVT